MFTPLLVGFLLAQFEEPGTAVFDFSQHIFPGIFFLAWMQYRQTIEYYSTDLSNQNACFPNICANGNTYPAKPLCKILSKCPRCETSLSGKKCCCGHEFVARMALCKRFRQHGLTLAVNACIYLYLRLLCANFPR